MTESGQDHEVMVESSFELKPSDSKVQPLNDYTTLLLKNNMLEYNNRITQFLPFLVDVRFGGISVIKHLFLFLTSKIILSFYGGNTMIPCSANHPNGIENP